MILCFQVFDTDGKLERIEATQDMITERINFASRHIWVDHFKKKETSLHFSDKKSSGSVGAFQVSASKPSAETRSDAKHWFGCKLGSLGGWAAMFDA